MTREEARLYAARHYKDPGGDTKSFNSDFNKIAHLERYLSEDEDRYRLILNNIIILSNVFDARHLSVVLFHLIDSHVHLKLNTYLRFLNLNVNEISEYDGVLLEIIRQEI
jgi:hypothetical protein